MHSCVFCSHSDVILAIITTGQMFCLNCSWCALIFSLVSCQISEDLKNGSSCKDSWNLLDVYSKHYAVVAQRSTSFSFKKSEFELCGKSKLDSFHWKDLCPVLKLRSSLFQLFISHTCLVLHLVFFFGKSLLIACCVTSSDLRYPSRQVLPICFSFLLHLLM